MKFVITAVIILLLCGGVPLIGQDQVDVAWTTYLGGSGNDEAQGASLHRLVLTASCAGCSTLAALGRTSW